MPHKKAKRSIRLAASEARGYNNPPTASDSLLPIASTSRDGQTPLDLDSIDRSKLVGNGGTGQQGKKDNKRRKPLSNGGTSASDLGGMSKSAYRILNAGKLREEYHADKKRKREEEEAAKNPNQKKHKTSLKPLPYESLSAFNRRVEQEMRGSINSVIQASKGTAQKKKENKKEKELQAQKKKKMAEDGYEEGDEIEEEDEEDPDRPKKYGKAAAAAGDKKKQAKEKPTPEESIDPFAPKRNQVSTSTATAATAPKEVLARGRTGKTEFDTASQVRRIDDVVLAPPSLAKPLRKGLLAKVLGPGGSASSGGARAEVATSSGGGGTMRIAGAEEPVGRSRLPVDPMMKMLLDRERAKAVKAYRELKEKKEAEA